MPTVTYTATKDASAINQVGGSFEGWSGWDDHHPVGRFNSGNYDGASFIYFPINFAGMTGITSATLRLTGAKNGSVHCFNTSGTTITIKRMTSDWGEGTDRGENVWSGNESWDWSNRVDAGNTTNDQVSWSRGAISDNVEYSVDITSIVLDWAPTSAGGSGNSNYGILLKNNSTSSADGMDFYTRHVSGKKPELDIVYTTNTAPNAPTSLSPTGGAIVNSLTPTFTGNFSDPNAGDTMSGYQIIVYNDSGGTSVKWDSGTITTSGATSFSKLYSGTTLTGNTTYWWKARTRDTNGSVWGSYSSLQSFKVNTPPPTPTGLSPSNGSTVSTLTPVFSGSSDDADPSDQLAYKSVIVYTDSSGSNVKWSSGDVSASGSTFSLTYSGSALSTGTQYWWKARVRDTNGAYSSYTSLQSFTTYTVGTPTNLSPSNSKVNTLTPTFQGTAAVTMNAFNYVIYQSDGTTQVFDSGTVASSGTAVSHVYGGAPALSFGTKYYWKLRTRDTSNVWSSFSALQPFWTNASPAATQVDPPNNGFVTTLTPVFTTDYSDADQANGFSDDPTNYTVEVSRVSDSVVMHTLSKSSGLSTTSNTVQRAAEGTALSFDVQYRWRARFTDSSGAANATGNYTGYFIFKPTQAPTISSFVVQAADLTTGEINKPNPTLTWSFSGSGGKAQKTKRLRVYLTSDSSLVYDSGVVNSSTASIQVPVGYLSNSIQYDFKLDTTDTEDVPSAQSSVTYTATWSPPPAITGFSVTADDETGRMIVEWDVSTLSEADFNRYTVYRQRVDTETSYTQIADVTSQSVTSYDDFEASLGVTYNYYITQWKTIAGDSPLEGPVSDIVQVSLTTDSWFIISTTDPLNLSLTLAVSSETHTAPFQEETFEPFGRSRKVIVRSGRFGNEGEIEFFWLASERSASELILDRILSTREPVYLKSPFGDNFRATLRAPQKTYMNGGHMTARVPFVEVA